MSPSPIPPVQVQLGVDNIQAIGTTAVPEPASFALLAMGGIGMIGRVIRKRRKTAAA